MKDLRETCKHSKLDDTWGDYKCLKLQHKIYDKSECKSCKFYEEDKNKKGGTEDER